MAVTSRRFLFLLRAGRLADDHRLTFNLGVRYDYVTNMPINQDRNLNFVVM